MENLIKFDVVGKLTSGHNNPIGSYRFASAPKVGEIIHIANADGDMMLRVITVEHFGYSDQETFLGSAGVLLCENVD
jgi:hypothetical protein